MNASYPEDFRYTKQHEWVRIERDAGGVGVIGITLHAQSELGEIVYVDLPKPGAVVEKDKAIGSVESVKAVSDIYSPLSGEVTAVNDVLTTSPEKLNQDPHGEGWLIKIKLSAPEEVNELLNAAEYQSYIQAEKGA